MRKLVQVIAAATGREPRIHEIPEVTEDTYRLVADISKLESLGYAPEMALEDGVADLAERLGENPEMPSKATIFTIGQQAET